MATRRRQSTSTSRFGVSRREAHDSSAFYARFTAPALTADSHVASCRDVDDVFCHDARTMPEIDDDSVALVVTSPPYFAGKEYEAALGRGGVPTSYVEYLRMLEDVFAECVRKLEPGGRMAVNVANLGRRPFRSLAGDVAWVLQDRLRLLLRGEVVWVKARGSTGSCAWGSFQRPGNPVLRDLTERVVVASKGRFDRALSARERSKRGLPSEASISRDEFMEATTDVWEIPAESATRVGHPAPFPVELPQRLIELYTYRGDLVLDPFLGAGTTAVAAVRTGRHFAGYDTDAGYVERSKRRLEAERRSVAGRPRAARRRPSSDEHARALAEGQAAREVARVALEQCGFAGIEEDVSFPEGIDVSFAARDAHGHPWHFDVAGGFTSGRPGLRRADVLWRALGKAAVLASAQPAVRLVLLTADTPPSGGAGEPALRAVVGPGKPIRDVIGLADDDGLRRLRELALAADA